MRDNLLKQLYVMPQLVLTTVKFMTHTNNSSCRSINKVPSIPKPRGDLHCEVVMLPIFSESFLVEFIKFITKMAAIINFLAKTFIPIGALLYAEQVYIRDMFPAWYAASSAFPGLNLPKAFGVVVIVNLLFSGLLLVYLGTKVGMARNNFKDKALKDGDKDAEARFSYPKMQAEGFSEHAKLFNCVQRGHQQALETYTYFVMMSMVGGVTFPVCTALAGLLWAYSRVKWAEGYSTGEPSKRYQSWVAYGIWSSLILVMFSGVGTVVKIMQ